MEPVQPLQVLKHSRTLRVTWLLTSVLALFPILTLWLIPRIPGIAVDLVSLTEPGTTAWLIAFIVGGTGCVIAIVGVILAFQTRKTEFKARVWTALAVACTILLWGYWFYATSRHTVSSASTASGHFVRLTWKPSATAAARYNIYRSSSRNEFPEQPLNAAPIAETSFVDANVQNSTTYFYAARAVDGQNQESDNSNIATADIP